MCGIAGILYTDRAPAGADVAIRRMTDALTHRGPDDAGYHVDDRAVLGHRRLSIIDVKRGHQPMYNEDRTIAVVFNGEIYNFEELRRGLIRDGHVFATNSDTETILHAYEQWGERCVERFRGMFAFAVRDARNDTLFLARDRFGKKPLFYASYAGKLVFASEMKAILSDPAFDRSMDDEALAAYFTLSYIPAPLTIFRGIRKLLPGHVLMLDRDGMRDTEYWDIAFTPDRARSEAAFIDEFRERMREAVTLRLMSEVPLGAFLSGGVDSSAVVAFMAQASAEPVNTFTIGFSGDTGFFEDERKYARMVATRYRTRHHEHEVRPDVSARLEAIVGSFDEPFADDSMVPSYFVSQIAREHVTVALSGLGGDEAFGGYERYLGVALSGAYNRVPRLLRSGVVAPLINALPESSSGGYRVNHLKRFVRSAAEEEGRRYFGFVRKIGPAYRNHLFSSMRVSSAAEGVEERFVSLYRNAKGDTAFDRAVYCDVKSYLPDDILALTDRLSMCHSLEVRVPFLDHPLFEFAATIPGELKLRWFRKKHLLKKALAGVLPGPVLRHKKQGFVAPLSRWLRHDLRAYARDMLGPDRLSAHGLFEPAVVRRVLADHFEGRETNDALIWALIVFQTWHHMYVERGSASRTATVPA